MKVSHPVGIEEAHNISVTLPQILSGGEVRDPEIIGGTPCFRGTRVPFKNLLDYLEGGETLDEFLEQFPGVTREMAIPALEDAKESLFARIA
jgi:uncharacterized protein (DUF433 family)